MDYAVKVALAGQVPEMITLDRQRTMYGGKAVAAGEVIYLFDSEMSGGSGLCARGEVVAAQLLARQAGAARQVPLVNLTIRRAGLVLRPLAKAALRRFTDWGDGRAETELNFKFYRQATDKLVGITPRAATFLQEYFRDLV